MSKPLILRIGLVTLASLLGGGALAQTARVLTVAARPQLLLHTEMHVARIRQAAADSQGRFLLTVSEDKTARIWDLETGQLRRTWVPPVAPGEEGKLFAGAFSPDGNTAAVGGWTSDGSSGFSVHLLDRTSGSLLRRIDGFRNLIVNLSWSPDGQWLAVATGGGGVSLVRPADGKVVSEDTDYSDSASGMDFSSRRQLAVVADDGTIRLYYLGDKGLAIAVKKKSAAGKRPTGVRFSPSGDELAVVHEDTGAVEVFSARQLEPLHLASGPRTAGLTRVAWIDGGRRLVAAGRLAERGRGVVLRIWDDRGRGAVRSVASPADNSILDLVPLKGGRLAIASADPLWAVFEPNGNRWPLIAKSDSIDFRGLLSTGLFAASNGQRIFIPDPRDRKTFASFGFDDRKLSTVDRLPAGVRLSAGLGKAAVKRTDSGDFLQSGDAQLAIDRHEQPRVMLADSTGSAVGSEWFLRLFDGRGGLQWKVPLSGTAWALGWVDEGRVLVAALGDGTIRWFKRENGQELVSFFLKTGSQRWVAWTPAGYYDSSPGGEDLLGWVVSRGASADYFPISRFRADYFNPDRVGLNPAASTADASSPEGPRKTPPTVEILRPEDGSSVAGATAALSLRIRPGSSAGVERVKVRVNGRLVQSLDAREFASRQIKGDEPNLYRIEVPFEPGENQVEVFAEAGAAVSKAASLKLTSRAAQSPDQNAFFAKPKLYVLAVGVSEYQLKDIRLGFAAKDAKDFSAALMAQKGKLYRDVQIRLLTDKEASRDDVVDGLDWIRKEVTSRDVAIVFLAGHGVNDADGVYYYLPFNADPERLKRTGVVFTEIKNTLSALPGKALFFIDTCHAGNVLGTGRRAANIDVTAVVNELASAENGVLVFSSSTGRQFSLENAAWGNGAFTKAAVEGISGKADVNKSGRITHKMLDFYISERVKELTGGRQSPVTIVPSGVPDFPIAFVGS